MTITKTINTKAILRSVVDNDRSSSCDSKFWSTSSSSKEEKSSESDEHNFKRSINFCIEVDRGHLTNLFKKRGWKKVAFNDNWHFFWGSLNTCYHLFHTYQLNDDQIVNHFPNDYELTRKDLLVKNIKRYRKDMERRNHPLSKMVKTEHGMRYLYLDIIPDTFVLPMEYKLFVEEFKKKPKGVWIVKPCGRSQGSGIFLINKLSQMRRFAAQAKDPLFSQLGKETHVVQRYIENPLLLNGKKFDMRLYVLVTSFSPLKAYLYKEGFCRVCATKYDINPDLLENLCIHLTNISLQRRQKLFNRFNKSKWSVENFGVHLNTEYGKGTAEKLFKEIKWIIVHSLIAATRVLAIERHSFELYGYDILVDENLKPWIIEVNACPSVSYTCNKDRALKRRLLKNILNIVLPPDGMPDIRWHKTPTDAALQNFERLMDEEIMMTDYKKWVEEKLKNENPIINKPQMKIQDQNKIQYKVEKSNSNKKNDKDKKNMKEIFNRSQKKPLKNKIHIDTNNSYKNGTNTRENRLIAKRSIKLKSFKKNEYHKLKSYTRDFF